MTKQTINVGLTADDGTGDTLRSAGIKINQNFSELYNAIASNNVITSYVAGAGIGITNNAGVLTITNTNMNPPVAASALTGNTLASNIVNSSLTSVGTLTGLTVTNPIIGSITGSAPAENLSGTSLSGTIVDSSLTSLGTLSSLTVDGTGTVGNVTFDNGNISVSFDGYPTLINNGPGGGPEIDYQDEMISNAMWLNGDGFKISLNDGTYYSQFATDGTFRLPVLSSEPTLPSTGTVAIADGTNWDPSGTGIECLVVYVNGTWAYLG